MNIKYIFLLVLVFALVSCERGIKPIDYGKDECHWCQMKIMDPQFGSEVVTDKGRVYKFDSAECLLVYLNQAECEHSHLVVTDFDTPHKLIPADSATYLISENMPSPMGANLNAFYSATSAQSYQSEKGGELLTWQQMVSLYQK